MPRNVRDRIPLRWPASWGEPQYRKLAAGPVNCLIVDHASPDVVSAYARDGITVETLAESGVKPVPGSKWPQIQTGGTGADADSGPTGVPWVDANGYLVQLQRTLDPDQPAWLDYGPSEGQTKPSQDSVRLAICDAETYGGHWLVRPDLASGETISKTIEFFAGHPLWRDYHPIGRLAVISDFAGANRASAVEALNLLPRRLIPYVIVPEARAQAIDLAAFRAILRIGKQPPASDLAGRLNQFAQRGGILIHPSSDDPYQIAIDTHLQMGRRNDMVRLWNAGSLNACYTASPDGKRHLVQLLNYAATVASTEITLGLATPYRSATLFTLDQPAPKELRINQVRAGIELQLPAFPVYAAIELEG